MTQHASEEFVLTLKESGDAYYSSTTAAKLLNNWYKSPKEEAFIDFTLRGLIIPPDLQVVEIGGGAGLRGIQMKRHFGERYIHTDISPPLVGSARRRGLRSPVADGLATPFRNDSVAAALLVGTSTIIRGEDLRIAQFQECSRILTSGGICIMVTSMLDHFMNMHGIDRRDFRLLAECGLEVTSVRRWGVVPGRFWGLSTKRLCTGIERMCSAAGLGIRQIVVATKR